VSARRLAIVLAIAANACGGGERSDASDHREKRQERERATAGGTLYIAVADTKPPTEALVRARVATAIDDLESRLLAERIVQRGRTSRSVEAIRDAVRASQRGVEPVIDVGVVLPDPREAEGLCTEVLSSYLELEASRRADGLGYNRPMIVDPCHRLERAMDKR
jgi:hypothetical protein